MRHSTGLTSSIGVVEVNRALDALVQSYAESNTLNENNKIMREALEDIASRGLSPALKDIARFAKDVLKKLK